MNYINFINNSYQNRLKELKTKLNYKYKKYNYIVFKYTKIKMLKHYLSKFIKHIDFVN